MPWEYAREIDLAAPIEVAALHHSVTALSLKKALTIWRDLYASRLRVPMRFFRLMRAAHTPPKCGHIGDFPDCHGQIVKE